MQKKTLKKSKTSLISNRRDTKRRIRNCKNISSQNKEEKNVTNSNSKIH